MRRRTLLAATLALPFGAFAQKAERMPKVGVLLFSSLSRGYQEAFRRGLRNHGYAEGKNIAIEWRAAEGSIARAEALAAELVALKSDVLVAFLTPAVQAAQKATRGIPIVMAYAGDPVGVGIVKSLARPDGNVTGLSSSSVEISGKRIELLREVVPRLTRIGLLINGADAFAKPFAQEHVAAAKHMGVALEVVDVRGIQEIDEALAKISKAGGGAVIVQGSLPALAWPGLALKHRVPSMASQRQAADAGALMHFGANADELIVRAGSYVDRLLKGAKPGDLPIEQPTRMDLVVNRKTAKALGIAISPAFIVRADAVID